MVCERVTAYLKARITVSTGRNSVVIAIQLVASLEDGAETMNITMVEV